MVTECEAIHPGYGFLAEDSRLVDSCIKNGIKFIGPKKEHMKKMGNKSEARKIMAEAGIPVIPGSENSTSEVLEALDTVKKIGFPVIIKASNGGGGRGEGYDENFVTNLIAKLETPFNSDSVY